MKRSVLKALLVVMSLVAFASCTDQVEQKEVQVMKLHDEVMPEMGALMDLKKQVKSRISQVDSTNTEAVSSLEQAVYDLEEADEAMMQWMREYKAPSDDTNKEEAMQYLEEKEQQMLGVQKMIDNAKSQAKSTLEQY